MEIRRIKIDENVFLCDKLIATIGAFDGIHIGHNKLFEIIREEKKKLIDYKTAVFTFDIHPDYLLNKRINKGKIESEEVRLSIFNRYNIDYVFIMDEEILKLEYEDFHNKILDKYNVEIVVVGKDFKYGKKALGNCDTLKQRYTVISDLVINEKGLKYSSSDVRSLLESGNVSKIKDILGHYFSVVGTVEKGAGLGKKLGFPTANINIDENYYNMLNGVYETNVYINGNIYKGVTNVGKNPTVNTQERPRIETYIIDFYEDLYGKTIQLEFISFLRNERKFNNVDELIEMIQKNVDEVKERI